MTIASDLRLAVRSLARRPGWTASVVATLTLGLTGAIVVGGICYGVLVRPLPFPEPDRIVRAYEVSARGHRMSVADPNYLDLERLPAISGLAQAQWVTTAARVGDEPLRLSAAYVSRDFFAIFGVGPVRGRLFTEEERKPGGPAAALISERLWRSRFGAEPDLAKLRLRVDDGEHAIVGVLPAAFDFPAGVGLWLPRERWELLPSRTAHNFKVFGRLANGTSLAAARAQASELGGRIAHEFGDRVDLVDFALVPVADSLVAEVRPALLIELAAAAFLLLVAIVNATALLLARLESRRRDLATRLALGARRGEIVVHLLAESALVVTAATAAALAAAGAALGAIRRLAPAQLPRIDAIRLDAPVVSLALAAALATAAALAWMTARRAAGWSVDRELRQSGNAVLGGRRGGLRDIAIAVQAGASLVLLIGTTLLASSLGRLLRVDPGFRDADTLVLDLYTPSPEEPGQVARRAATLARLEGELAALPGVDAAGLVSALPVGASSANGTFIELSGPDAAPGSLEGFEDLVHSGARTGDATYLVASEGYFPAMGIPLRSGRLFEPRDTIDRQHVALVSESVARTLWPGESALGRYLEFGNMDGDVRALEVVGVVADVRQDGLAEAPTPAIYTCFRQRPQGAAAWSVVLAGGARSTALPGLVRARAREVFPDAPTRLRTIAGVLDESLADRRMLLELLALFAGVAVALAAAGVFGAVALGVASRRREYALRMALGADGSEVTRHAVLTGLTPVAAGLGGGLLLAVAASGALRALLFGVAPNYLPAYGAALAVVAAAALAAAWLPARRAATVEPASALRAD